MRRLIENLSTLAIGIVVGTLGVVVHNYSIGWFPFGLIVALAGSVAASGVMGVHWARRGVRIWFLIGWSFVALRAGMFGNSDELLIMANGTGSAYLGLGLLLVFLSIWARI